MDYRLDFTERDGRIVATLGGVRTPETLIAAAAEIAGHCREHGIKYVLIDVRPMQGGLDTLETFEVAGQAIPSQGDARQLVRSAILDHSENLERIRFFETVALNRGLMIKVFDDEADAVRWLHTAGDLG